jgi:peptidoglycan/xylan/chitin deacetylase (PgdA/CDA1 family)
MLAMTLLSVVVPSADAVTHLTQDRCRSGRVALTFDDGPSPTITPRLVRLLQRLDVPATFFVVGWRVAAYPEVVRAIDAAGFTIGNHTWDHPDLTTLPRREIRRQVFRTRRALLDAGVVPSTLVRPPYGAADDRVRRILADLRLVPAFWTVDSLDWDGRPARRIRRGTVARVLDRGRSGSVVLHHDGVTNAPAMLAALPREVARLRAEGLCFVPLVDADPGTW